jgi:8-oxo-dGTP diphosphatase
MTLAPDARPLPVVAAVIVRDAHILACRRRPERSSSGLWEFPGGKIEPDELPTHALAREIFEELGVTIEVGRLFHTGITPVGDALIDLRSYLARLASNEPTSSTDHDELRWLSARELASVEWALPDRPVVDLLIEDDAPLLTPRGWAYRPSQVDDITD